MHSNAKIVAWVALAYAATSLASMTVIPFDLENRRDREVIVHIGYFRTEAEARSAYVGDSAKADQSIGRIRLKAGEKYRATGGDLIKGWQGRAPETPPGEGLGLRSTVANGILEEASHVTTPSRGPWSNV